ncbi:MAG: hypothetical protein ABW116_13475 [Candidatus Sedimenticola sp. 20ELBAFRAG]
MDDSDNNTPILNPEYMRLVGDRVDEIMQYLEESESYEDFRVKLCKMTGDEPKKDIVNEIEVLLQKGH